MSDAHVSKLPGKAVSPGGDDLVAPAAELLRGLSLLPEKGVTAGPGAAFTGTPDSVAVIESGATALSKLWALGLGGSLATLWTSVGAWWVQQDGDVQVGVLYAAAVATAAIALGLAYIVGSDVRGRAAASVATINARSDVAQAIIREAASLSKQEDKDKDKEKEKEKAKEKEKENDKDKAAATWQVAPISPPLPATWVTRPAAEEEGWIASAFRCRGDEAHYWISRGSAQGWIPTAEVELG